LPSDSGTLRRRSTFAGAFAFAFERIWAGLDLVLGECRPSRLPVPVHSITVRNADGVSQDHLIGFTFLAASMRPSPWCRRGRVFDHLHGPASRAAFRRRGLPYSASKAASSILGCKPRPNRTSPGTGVARNSICPGLIREPEMSTPDMRVEQLAPGPEPQRRPAQSLATARGFPHEIAHTGLFLASTFPY